MSAERVETIEQSDFEFLQLINRLGTIKIREALQAGVDPSELPIDLQHDSDETIGLWAYHCDLLIHRLEEIVEIAKSNRYAALLALGRSLRNKGKGEFTLVDEQGRKLCAIKSNVEVYASIQNLESAKAWLNTHGFPDILKPEVKCPTEKEQTQNMIELLVSNGFGEFITEKAHPATLGSAMKDVAYAGEVLPSEEDGIKVTLQPLAKISKARG